MISPSCISLHHRYILTISKILFESKAIFRDQQMRKFKWFSSLSDFYLICMQLSYICKYPFLTRYKLHHLLFPSCLNQTYFMSCFRILHDPVQENKKKKTRQKSEGFRHKNDKNATRLQRFCKNSSASFLHLFPDCSLIL